MHKHNADKMNDFVFENGSNVFFTSDTHFNHSNIIKFCDRPFVNVREMDDTLINNWNNVVGEDDIVFHLGDFAWGGSQIWNDTLNKLNGRKYLILGNHDMKNIRQGYMDKFEFVGYQMQIRIEDRSIYLNHYPFLCYGGSYRGEDSVWQLFGHVHTCSGPHKHEGKDDERLKYLFPFQYDVGVDNNNYAPISWSDVKKKIMDQINESQQTVE